MSSNSNNSPSSSSSPNSSSANCPPQLSTTAIKTPVDQMTNNSGSFGQSDLANLLGGQHHGGNSSAAGALGSNLWVQCALIVQDQKGVVYLIAIDYDDLEKEEKTGSGGGGAREGGKEAGAAEESEGTTSTTSNITGGRIKTPQQAYHSEMKSPVLGGACPVVMWNAETARFEPAQATVSIDAILEEPMMTQVCLGVYGVLTLGRNSYLIFVTERKEVAVLPHLKSVDEISGLAYVPLPVCPQRAAQPPHKSPALHPSVAGGENARATPTTTTQQQQINSSSIVPNPVANAPQLSNHVLKEYLHLLGLFCTGKAVGGLNLLVSFSADVSETASKSHLNTATHDRAFTPRTPHHNHAAGGAPLSHGSISTPSQSLHEQGSSSHPYSSSLLQWNRALRGAFVMCNHFCPPIIRGCCTVVELQGEGDIRSSSDNTSSTTCRSRSSKLGSSKISYAHICRMSCKQAGTRYNKRGLDEEGFAANFAETEIIVWNAKLMSNVVMVRGSVPVRWTQPADLTLKPAVHIDAEESESAFANHVSIIEAQYEWMHSLHCVDLLSAKNKVESPLSQQYSHQVLGQSHHTEQVETAGSLSSLPKHHSVVHYKHVDLGKYLHDAKGFEEVQSRLTSALRSDLDACGMSVWSQAPPSLSNSPQKSSSSIGSSSLPPLLVNRTPHTAYLSCLSQQQSQQPVFVRKQTGLLRFNCLDCLDRTNAAQFFCAEEYLMQQLKALMGVSSSASATATGVDENEDDGVSTEECKAFILKNHEKIAAAWIKQGHSVSKAYTGNNALFPEVIQHRRVRTLKGKLQDGRTAMKRFVQQNFFDGQKQDCLSLVTCAHDPVPQAMMKNSNPFERHMTTMNAFVVAGLLIGMMMLMGNSAILLGSKAWRLDIVVAQVIWSAFVGAVFIVFSKDRPSYTNSPMLT